MGAWHACVEQVFIRVSNFGGRLTLQAGRFASPFGSYAGRHLTTVDPFIRPPLAYDYRTIMSRTIAPPNADGFLHWKYDPHTFRSLAGAPPVWGVPYQWGALVSGHIGEIQYRVGAMNSAPSSEVDAWGWDADRFKHPSLVLGVQAPVSADLPLDASYNRGPYRESEITTGDHTVYTKEMVSLDATLARGPLMARAEDIRDRWMVPNVSEDPVEWAYGAEAQINGVAGFSIAVRYGYVDFRSVSDDLGTASTRPGGRADWDHDIARYEIGLGYRLARNAGLLGTFLHNENEELVGEDPDDDLFAARLWWAFWRRRIRCPDSGRGPSVGPYVSAMTTHDLPTDQVMLEAFIARDTSYDGIFVTGVRTTGIFCRPTCSAKKPRPEHLQFFGTAREALLSGFRPCKRCRPMEPSSTAQWLRPLFAQIESSPGRRWTDQDVRAAGLSPTRVRRWFKRHHGMTFHAYSRARRLGAALGHVKNGSLVSRAAFDAGYDSLSGFQAAFRQYFGSSPNELERATVVRVQRITTPLGPMLVGATDDALCLLELVDRRALSTQVARIRKGLGAVFVPGRNPIVDRTAREVESYFAGALEAFSVPTTAPGTDSQKTVWGALAEIPYGETRSYAELALGIGRPSSVRAVGSANGMNALAIIVPCHRVVGADGKLVGYGGGLWRKQRLLELEVSVTDSRTEG